jgi:alcohol-forming fatty acyl-CoA reductase
MTKLTKMQEFYRGKTVLITGASGFMGKVLIEKLLYSCSEIKQIMILVRPKRGKTGAQRVQEFTTLPVSSNLINLFILTVFEPQTR